MKQSVRHISIIFLAALAMLSTGCVYDAEICETESAEHSVLLTFTLRLDQLGFASTRAGGIWNASDGNEGSTFDNTIDLNNGLFLMLVASDGTLTHIEKENISFLPLGNGLIKGTTQINIKKSTVSDGSYRLMVFANYLETEKLKITGCATLKELDAKLGYDENTKTYNSAVEWYGEDGKRKKYASPYIPMWGVSGLQEISDGKATEMGTIDLLRSVAKVKIQFTDELKKSGYRLVSAQVSKCNRKVYPFPAGWKDAESTVGSASDKYDKAFYSPQNEQLKDPLKVTAPGFATECDDSDNDIVFYLPEIKVTEAISIKVTYLNGLGEERTLSMDIDNFPDQNSSSNYENGKYTVNRNHLYQFTLTYDLTKLDPGKISYKLVCWNHRTSAIGWNPTTKQYSFCSERYVKDSKLGDPEAAYCYVTYPTYTGDDTTPKWKDDSSYADYSFSFTGPEGAVWKAFLVEGEGENRKEYSADNKFTTGSEGSIEGLTYSGEANTPSGFFFATGNDDDNEQRASTTGRARTAPFHIKVGTRIKTTDDFKSKESSDLYGVTLALNSNGQHWKDKNEVPTCYLVIKVAYDGVNFSQSLPINPSRDKKSPFSKLQYAGNESMIQIRQLFPIFNQQVGDEVFIKGGDNYWWGPAEGLN